MTNCSKDNCLFEKKVKRGDFLISAVCSILERTIIQFIYIKVAIPAFGT